MADVADNRTGGMTRVMYGSGDALVRLGHKVDYVYGPALGKVWPVKLRRFVIPARAASHAIRLHCAGGNYDIVEMHEPIAAAYIALRRLYRNLPPCVVLSFGIEARGHRAKLEYRRTVGLPVSLKQRFSPWSVLAQTAFSLRNADHIICFNSEDREYLLRNGRRPQNVTQTRSGVDLRILQAGSDHLRTPSSASLDMLFLGTWIERKGISEVVSSVAGLFERLPTATLTIAGCGCTAEAVLRHFPDDCRPRVRVIPHISSDEELVAIYQNHQIFILPSYFEGQPLAMLEAAAFGLAIVTTDTCGMRDFITDGENGLLVPVGQPRALFRALVSLTSDPALALKLGSSAQDKVQRYTWDSVALEFESAFESTRLHYGGSRCRPPGRS